MCLGYLPCWSPDQTSPCLVHKDRGSCCFGFRRAQVPLLHPQLACSFPSGTGYFSAHLSPTPPRSFPVIACCSTAHFSGCMFPTVESPLPTGCCILQCHSFNASKGIRIAVLPLPGKTIASSSLVACLQQWPINPQYFSRRYKISCCFHNAPGHVCNSVHGKRLPA